MFPFKFRSTIVTSLLQYINRNQMEICCVHVKMLVFLSCRRKKQPKKDRLLLCFASPAQTDDHLLSGWTSEDYYINITSLHRAALEESSKVLKSH